MFRKHYAANPEEARYTYTMSSVADDRALFAAAVSESHGKVRYEATLNEKLGGSGTDPTPGDLMLGALVTCQALSLKVVAMAMGIALSSLTVEAEGDVDHRGVLMLDGVRAGFEEIRLTVRYQLAADPPPERVERWLQAAERSCAVTDALRHPTSVVVERIALTAP